MFLSQDALLLTPTAAVGGCPGVITSSKHSVNVKNKKKETSVSPKKQGRVKQGMFVGKRGKSKSKSVQDKQKRSFSSHAVFGQLDWGTLLTSEEQIPEPALHRGMLAIIKALKEKLVTFMSFQTFLL